MEQKIQFLRSNATYSDKTTAINALKTKLSGRKIAGEPIVAFYNYTESSVVKIGVVLAVAVGDGSNYTIFESSESVPSAITKAIADAIEPYKVKTVDESGGLSNDASTGKVSIKVDSSDNVISTSSSGIKATLSLSYDSTNKKIKLVGKDTSTAISEIDASAFVKDGMLKGAELVTTQEASVTTEVPYIKLTFNTDAKDEVIRFSVKGLVDVYTAENDSINITDNKIKVNVDNKSIKLDLSNKYLYVDTIDGGTFA